MGSLSCRYLSKVRINALGRVDRKNNKLRQRYVRTMFAGLLGLGLTCASVPCATGQSVELGSLNGTNGFNIKGLGDGDKLGLRVSGAGDVNGDGFDDVIVGVHYADFNGLNSGSAYVVFGKGTQTSAGLDLSTIDGTNGFRINGELPGDYAGLSVSRAGDVNNDGFDDVLIGCPYCDVRGEDSGSAYVVFGKATQTSSALDLSALDGTSGFKVYGEAQEDRAGFGVSAAGDVNNDGFADIILGAHYANDYYGAAYIIFGKTPTTSTIELSALDANDGIKFEGAEIGDRTGKSVAGGGDINNDGFDDVIIGASHANTSDRYSGAVYVVFGRASFGTARQELIRLNGTDGFRMNGTTRVAYAGASVSSAGDVNGDGFADILIGAPFASHAIPYSGAGYVVFGRAEFSSPEMELSALNGTDGFVLEGEAFFDQAGRSVAGASDLNKDGFDDLIIGAHKGTAGNGDHTGTSYVVFGKPAFTSASLALSSLDGSNGLRYFGEAPDDSAGYSVSGAGDVNGDGSADLIIGAYGHDSNGKLASGASYVVFGPTAANVSKMKVSLNFAKPAKDSVTIRGTLKVSAGFTPLGQQVVVNVGGSTRSLTLDEKGSAKDGQNLFQIKTKTNGGVVQEQDAPFRISFKKGDFAQPLSDDGLINANISKEPVGVGMLVSLAGKLYHAVAPLSYSAKQGKTGKAK